MSIVLSASTRRRNVRASKVAAQREALCPGRLRTDDDGRRGGDAADGEEVEANPPAPGKDVRAIGVARPRRRRGKHDLRRASLQHEQKAERLLKIVQIINERTPDEPTEPLAFPCKPERILSEHLTVPSRTEHTRVALCCEDGSRHRRQCRWQHIADSSVAGRDWPGFRGVFWSPRELLQCSMREMGASGPCAAHGRSPHRPNHLMTRSGRGEHRALTKRSNRWKRASICTSAARANESNSE